MCRAQRNIWPLGRGEWPRRIRSRGGGVRAKRSQSCTRNKSFREAKLLLLQQQVCEGQERTFFFAMESLHYHKYCVHVQSWAQVVDILSKSELDQRGWGCKRTYLHATSAAAEPLTQQPLPGQRPGKSIKRNETQDAFRITNPHHPCAQKEEWKLRSKDGGELIKRAVKGSVGRLCACNSDTS